MLSKSNISKWLGMIYLTLFTSTAVPVFAAPSSDMRSLKKQLDQIAKGSTKDRVDDLLKGFKPEAVGETTGTWYKNDKFNILVQFGNVQQGKVAVLGCIHGVQLPDYKEIYWRCLKPVGNSRNIDRTKLILLILTGPCAAEIRDSQCSQVQDPKPIFECLVKLGKKSNLCRDYLKWSKI